MTTTCVFLNGLFSAVQPLKLERSAIILLALMTYRQNQRHIGSFVIAVKRQISGLAARNDLFAQTL